MQCDLSQWTVVARLMNYGVQKKKEDKGFLFLICDTTKIP